MYLFYLPVFAARCYASAAYVIMRCLCVCLVSITFVHSVKTNKHIFNIFHRRVSSHSSFSITNGMAIFRREPTSLLTGALNAGGVGRNRDSGPIFGFIAMLWTLRPPGAVNNCRPISGYQWWLMELVLSTDCRPSSGVSQSRSKSVYGTESHAPVNSRREQFNLRSFKSNVRE